jgi:hypothetical protein
MEQREFISLGNLVIRREHIAYIKRVDEKTIEVVTYVPHIKIQTLIFQSAEKCETCFKEATANLIALTL